jgi:hypothetical protein
MAAELSTRNHFESLTPQANDLLHHFLLSPPYPLSAFLPGEGKEMKKN